MRRLLTLALLLPTLARADYASVVLADSPAYYWHLGETSGTTATNSGSQGSGVGDGTYTGGYTLNQTGIPGYAATDGAVTLNGSTGYIHVADTGGKLNIPSSANATFTVEVWYKHDAGGSRTIISNGLDDTTDRYAWDIIGATWQVRPTSGSPTCQGGTYGSIAGPAYTVGAWHHLVGTTVATGGGGALSAMDYYVNGSLISTLTSFTGTLCTTAFDQIDIGRQIQTVDRYTTGTLDEVAIYYSTSSSAGRLTQSQVTAHYNAGIGISAQGWPFVVQRPSLPRFMDEGYFAKAVRRGYHTGNWSATTPLPRVVGFYAPFSVMPGGSVRQ